jgi:tetratricopeptide (TPR) repeat protein
MRALILALCCLVGGCVATMQPGIDAMNRGDLNEAERNFQQGLERGDTLAFNNLGVVYQRRGEREKAIQYYTVAARYGHQLAISNLIALGAPVPAPDLANARSQRNAADTANTLMLMQALQPRPMPPPTSCNSYRVGNSVQTDCR